MNNSTIPCRFKGIECNWPACPENCIGRPGADPIKNDTVANIPDEELLRRAVTNTQERGLQRVVIVMHTFSLGSTYAAQLCRRFGLDPDEVVKR